VTTHPSGNRRDAVVRPVDQLARNATRESVRQTSTDRCYRVLDLGRTAARQLERRLDYGAVVMRGPLASILPVLRRVSARCTASFWSSGNSCRAVRWTALPG